ncbi:BTB/POZ domain-containing protein [Drosera capensis]
MCIDVLKQCENLLPLADELKIVNRCVEAIASITSAEQIASSFSRLEYSSSGRLQMSKSSNKCEGDWWIQDLSALQVNMYERVLIAMKCRGVRPESMGASLVNYAQKELTKKPSLWNSKTRPDFVVSQGGQERVVVETIVSFLPVEQLTVPISFLFGLLRSAVMNGCDAACRRDLERRIGSQLDIAILDGLLIPSFSHASQTMFDVDTVHRILVNFSQQGDSDGDMEDAPSGSSRIDRIRQEKTLQTDRLPEAGAHAAQNERLPLQSIIQVLYHEQLRLRNVMFSSYPDEDHKKPMLSSWRNNSGVLSASMSQRDNYASLRRENRELKLELARLRMKLNDLEKDHVCMKRSMERTGSRRFTSSFSKNLGKLGFFVHGASSWGSTSPSKGSLRTDLS